MTGITEFVILSGPEVHDYLVQVRGQLRRHLARHFPHFEFSLASQEGEGMGFLVVPVVGTVGGEDSDFSTPKHSVLAEIRLALEAFVPAPASVH